MPKSENGSETMKTSKHRFGKRLSKLLSNMLWHFNRSTPDFSTIDKHRRTSSSPKNSKSIPEKNVNQPRRLRANSLRIRTSTLMSIEEENESDIIHCK